MYCVALVVNVCGRILYIVIVSSKGRCVGELRRQTPLNALAAYEIQLCQLVLGIVALSADF